MADCDDAERADANGHDLSLATRTVERIVGPEIAAPQARKFVQIEVAQVVNPQRIPVSFTVHYRSTGGDKILLGMFSLFPPDNPGTFIVATQGKLQTGGTVIITLVPLEDVHEPKELRVQVKRIDFIPG